MVNNRMIYKRNAATGYTCLLQIEEPTTRRFRFAVEVETYESFCYLIAKFLQK